MKYLILKNGNYAVGKYVPEGATVIDTPRPTTAHSWNGSKWVFDGFSAEEFTTDADGLIVVTQAGSTSGSASILNGVTTT